MTGKRKVRRAAKTLLSRDAILALKGGRYEDVSAFGGIVRVAAVSAGARDMFELSLQDLSETDRRKDFRARLLVMTCIDENGEPLFGPEDVAVISKLEAGAVDPIVEVAMRLNGLSARDREELEGNS